MKPVTSKTSLSKLLDNASILMLKSHHEGICYMTQLLASPSSSITTKAGISLPNELLNKIISLVASDTDPSFCLVQITSIKGKLLKCRRISDEGWPFCGELGSASDIELFEEFLDNPNTAPASQLGIPPIKPSQNKRNEFELYITPLDNNLRASAVLFHDIKVPDVIAFMEDGECGFCRERNQKFFFCPGCTGGWAQQYDMFMGCGVDLVSPVCIGLDVAREHKEFLQTYYREPAPEDEEEAMKAVLKARFDELGYQME
jgi:hypothetical protein